MIKINNDYYVAVDDMNYTLIRDRHKLDKKGNPVLERLSYHSTLPAAIMSCAGYLQRELLKDQAVELWQAAEMIRGINEALSQLIKKEFHEQ